MSKTYVFEFMGTKEDFLNRLNVLFTHNITYSGIRYYYFSDYIIKIMDNEIHFGVERGGHSGGYWFIPTMAEFDDRIEFCGSIRYVGPEDNRYIGPEDNRGRIGKAIDHIGEFLLFILLLPIFLILKLYTFVEWIIRKIGNRPKPPIPTTEDRLLNLMETHLNCVRKHLTQ